MALPDMDRVAADTYDPLDGMVPGAMLEPEDLAETEVELEDDGLRLDDASQEDVDTSGNAFQDPADTSRVPRESLRDNSDTSFADPNSPEMRAQRVRQREAEERLEQEYRHTAERMQVEADRFDAERERIRAQYQNVENQLVTVQNELANAIDDADSRRQLQLNSMLQELNQAKAQLANHFATVPTREAVTQRYNEFWGQRRDQIRSQYASDIPEPQNETARAWQKTNGWMASPQYKAAIPDLYRINADLVREGYDATHDSFYRELATRLKQAHPELPLKDSHGRALTAAAQKSASPKRGNGPPVASARSVSTTQQKAIMKNAKGKPVVVLDAADKAILRSMGRDPNDKTVQRYYAQSKYERLRDEQLMRRVR